MNGNSRAKSWLILLALAGGVLVFLLVERSKGWTARSRAEQLEKELLAAETPRQADAIARELGLLDEAAVEPLVRALVSEDPLLSAAAADEISRRLAAWRQLPRKKSGTKVAALVKALAEASDAIPPEQQFLARQWAEGILLWPLKGSGVDAADVLANCEVILALPQPDEALAAERLALLEERSKRVPEVESSVAIESPLEVIPTKVPMNLPPIVSPKNLLPPSVEDEPAPIAEFPEHNPIPPYPREPRGIYVPRARPIQEASPPSEPKVLPQQEPSLLPPIKASAAVEDLAASPDLEVMLELQSDDGATVAAAEKELARRGYKGIHLALARQLTDPDSEVRLKLVQSLPRARGVDPRPWLLHLSEDHDDKVRSAALSILRTSQDPELLRKLR